MKSGYDTAFIDEIKLLFKNIILIFTNKEVKEAYGVLYEIDRELADEILELSGAWDETRLYIEKYLILRKDTFLKTLREKKMTPREIVYNITYNLSANEIEITDLRAVKKRGYKILNTYITKKIDKVK